MMGKTRTFETSDVIERELTSRLMSAFGTDQFGRTGVQPVRDAFRWFGSRCVALELTLEEAMSIATSALQEFFARTGGQSSDAATTITAGIALGAVARAYQQRDEDRQRDSEQVLIATQLARLDALHQINRAATAKMPLSALLDVVVHAVVRATGADACCIYLYDNASDSLALRAAAGLNPASVGVVAFRVELGITGRAATERKPVVAEDAVNHEAYQEVPIIGDGVYGSQVSVPMLTDASSQLVGVLNVLTVSQRSFDRDEVAFLETVAGELAISIENARMQSVTDAQLRRKVAELGTLQRLSRTVASTLDLPSVLRAITEAALELINAEAAAVFRVPMRSEMSNVAVVPTIEYRAGQSRQVMDEGRRDELIMEVIETGAARLTVMDYVDGSSRLFCLPLRSARERWGALCIRLRAGSELTEEELGLLQAFTDSASIAIENAQLYREARHSLDTASTLLQEMHHRVRNNLQTVAALLSIQMRQDPTGPAASSLREAASRIQSIAAVHDLLSDEERLSGATIDAIARLVAEEARTTMIRPGLKVDFNIEPSEIALSSRQGVVVALLTNELVANAVVHGFECRDSGNISIRSRLDGNMAVFEVENDGERVPRDFDPANTHGLGMRIVQRLVSSDLRGEFTIRGSDTGTVATITFPIAETPTTASERISV